MKKFWQWIRSEAGGIPCRELALEGYIAEESWLDDDVTPKQFKADLYNGLDIPDDIVVRISSPGGDCFAAAKIYDMLMEYPGKVSMHIDGLAASAASVIAMAGDEVLISPVSCLMIHNPSTIIAGESIDLQAGIELLNEVKESILNAYAIKTGLPRLKLSRMMDSETWMSANKAVELGFADGILYSQGVMPQAANAAGGFLFDRVTVTNAILGKLPRRNTERDRLSNEEPSISPIPKGIPIDQLDKRLALLK
jgi:ATP-dependent Clp protease, protease subunit